MTIRSLLRAGKLLNLLLWPFFLIFLPFVLLVVPKARAHIRERFGLGATSSKKDREPTLFHLASLGEANAASPLIRKLAEEGFPLILTATSESGRSALIKSFPGLPVSLLPLDLPGIWEPFWLSRRIRRVILFETEIWPMMLLTAYSRNIPVMVVNGRLSPGGFAAMMRWRFFLRPLFAGLSMVLAGSADDRDRYLKMGVREEVLSVTGNLKWDMPPPDPSSSGGLKEDLSSWISRFENAFSGRPASGSLPVGYQSPGAFDGYLRVVLGSAHPQETLRILDAFLKDPWLSSRLHFLVAPRHLQKLPEFLKEGGVLSSLAFELRSGKGRHDPDLPSRGPIVSILDTHGELRTLYGLCHVAITGGTFDRIGGHSPVEAASAGLPQIAGPWTDHVSTLVDRLAEGGGLVRVKNEEELACRIKWFLENPDGREKAGMMAQEVFRSEQGALSRTLASVRRFLLDPRPEAS